jgi:hypothetical protein
MIRRIEIGIGIGIDFIFSVEELKSGLQFLLNYNTESELEVEF